MGVFLSIKFHFLITLQYMNNKTYDAKTIYWWSSKFGSGISSADHVPNGSWFTCNAGSVFIFAFWAAWAAWKFIDVVLVTGCPSRLPFLITGGSWNVYHRLSEYVNPWFFWLQKCTQDTQLHHGLGLRPSCIQSSPRGSVQGPYWSTSTHTVTYNHMIVCWSLW